MVFLSVGYKLSFASRKEMLQKFDDGYFGESISTEGTESTMYWPGHVEQLKYLLAGCNTCQERRHQNPAALFHSIEIPEYPFQQVACDLFHLSGKDYFLLVDYISK